MTNRTARPLLYPRVFTLLASATAALAAGGAMAQSPTAGAGWQACAGLMPDSARLACFDRFTREQATPADTLAKRNVPLATATAPTPPASAPATPVEPLVPATRVIGITTEEGCKDRQYSDLSRYWELESGSNCGTFGIRGYRPLSLSLIASDSVNQQPTSPGPNNTVTTPNSFSRKETRVQLSVRTKVAQGLLTGSHPTLNDSLWFGYTQQSYWQLFNKGLSRPFRSTDHEPEVVYVYPTDANLPGGWRLRYSGLGVVHQSNGQSEPQSRSWNRAYLMAGIEKDNRFRVQARVWKRLPENAATDDNPDISDFIGRGEVSGFWNPNKDNLLGLTVRSALRGGGGRGSARIEWFKTLGNGNSEKDLSGLRLHTQLFTGYGDTLIDYNRKRTVLSVGLSLVDW